MIAWLDSAIETGVGFGQRWDRSRSVTCRDFRHLCDRISRATIFWARSPATRGDGHEPIITPTQDW